MNPTHIVPLEVVGRVLREEEADVVPLRSQRVVQRARHRHLDHRLLRVDPTLINHRYQVTFKIQSHFKVNKVTDNFQFRKSNNMFIMFGLLAMSPFERRDRHLPASGSSRS